MDTDERLAVLRRLEVELKVAIAEAIEPQARVWLLNMLHAVLNRIARRAAMAD